MSTSERLADAKIQAFLHTREVVVLATLGPDGAPQAAPMWFVHTPDALFMISLDGLAKVHSLKRDPRVAVAAETTRPDGAIGGLSIKGRVEFLAESDERRQLAERFLQKYHPRLEGLWRSRVMPGNRVMFRITPERVRSWGLA